MPEFVRPMLATPVDRPFSDPGWLFELKLDGYRVEAVVHDGRVKLLDAQPQGRGHVLPGLRRAPATDWLAGVEAIVDGEMVALDADGRPSFSLLQDLSGLTRPRRPPRRAPPPPTRRSRSRTDDAQRARSSSTPSTCSTSTAGTCSTCRSRSASSCSSSSSASTRPSRYVGHVLEHGEDFQDAVITQELEGSIAKLRRSRYEPGGGRAAGSRSRRGASRSSSSSATSPGKGSHARPRRAARGDARGLAAGATPARWAAASTRRTRTLMRHLLDEHARRRAAGPGRAAASAALAGASRATSSGPSSPNGRRTGCCDRPPSRAVRWAVTRRTVTRERVEPAGEARERASRASGGSSGAPRGPSDPPEPSPHHGHGPRTRALRRGPSRDAARVSAGRRRTASADEARAGRAGPRRRPRGGDPARSSRRSPPSARAVAGRSAATRST